MATLVTHNGSFHQDELFAIALLQIIFDDLEIIRTRDVGVIEKADFVVDVGGVFDPMNNRFDHHQEQGGGKRENGIPYASFGLVWKTYAFKLLGDKRVVDLVDKKIVQPIDAADNGVSLFAPVQQGVYPYLFDNALHALTPTWRDEKSIDEAFFELLPFVKVILEKEIQKAIYFFQDGDEVKKAYIESVDKRIIILDHPYAWKSILAKYPEPLFVIHPDQNTGEWVIAAVKSEAKGFNYRKLFPKSWAGKKKEELAAITGVSDAEFCHKNLFIAKVWSKESAIAMAKMGLE